ncbi:MAG: type II secretion system F family protein [Oscillospiraceae bacterium]|nr:type II secretion system F family protein [Oscillospiraceae bacterium]
MIIVIMVIATLLIVSWLILLSRVNADDWKVAAYNKVLENCATIEKLRQKENEKDKKSDTYGGIANFDMKLFTGRGTGKRVKKLESDCIALQNGNLSSVNILAMPGYVLVREFATIGKGELHKTIMANSCELYGKKHAAYKTKHVLAKLLSYPVIGASINLMIGAMLLGTGNRAQGLATIGLGSTLVLVLVYAIYDEQSDCLKKRRFAISRQFPNVVSKLALLVTSGMVMDRAWKEAAYSQESEIYMEMRKTSMELDNLVSPEVAFGNFISRCNTKETAKLASAIMQNLSKGNAEVGRLMKDMAREAWQERRHMAKREAEKANSKLMLPTMLLFLAILVMLMVPIAMNFSGI